MNPNSFILLFTALMPWNSTELVKPSHRNDDKDSSFTFRARGGQVRRCIKYRILKPFKPGIVFLYS